MTIAATVNKMKAFLDKNRKVRDSAVNSQRTGFEKPDERVDRDQYAQRSGRRPRR